ncbi:unnamed protein product [Lathyrus oleraceus]
MVENEKKHTMLYIYATMGVSKESIEKSFNSNLSKYKDIFSIIDKRLKCQILLLLHVARYYLNHGYFYNKPEIENDPILVKGDIGHFGICVIIRQRSTLAPTKWCKPYGAKTLDL